MGSTFETNPRARETHDPCECFNQIPSVWMPARSSSSKMFSLKHVSTHEYKNILMKRKKKNNINVYMVMSTLIKKQKTKEKVQ